MASSVQGEPLLEDGESLVERQVAARQRVHSLLQEFEGFLERRLFRHFGASSFTYTWIRPSWKRTARGSPATTSAAWATTCPSSRSAIAYPRCRVARGLNRSSRRPVEPSRSPTPSLMPEVGPGVPDDGDLLHRVADLVVGRVEVRRQADAGARTVVDEDLAAQQLLGHGLTMGNVQDHHPAALARRGRGARADPAR